MFDDHVEHARTVFDKIVSELEAYEAKFQMTSEQFIEASEKAELPETEEFFSWKLSYVGYQNLVNRFGFSR